MGPTQSAAMLVAALAMVLHALLAGFGASAQATPGFRAVAATTICIPASGDGHSAPSCDSSRSHCCLRGESGDAPITPIAALETPAPMSIVVRAGALGFESLAERRLAGWASSWSAQAPPRFS
ncbi:MULTISPECIES: hypothetical protein [Methylosinus]|uniref:DUF2946 domain-containing protein n=1 Tax=Methylosinus trichosporium (strain ATCC 35070 / NCIMB 11131 / UNIQEM 75 / OB3b) TaxID=595536 RepID=A0A2D2CWZ5_METT3|nr:MULTISPECIES: hypothetical protein [Methylosinus]ATQ67204.1 hypothetical protein CQW49_04320 [Methylosinus trichosporium OB3b]OBS52220.1 hypothetical protein A8B73_12335 [Methylosinus sp. 3S-1]